MDAQKIDIKPESEFRQVDSWDSLTGMAILVMIKSEYGIDITVESFKKMSTVKDVYTFILSEKQ